MNDEYCEICGGYGFLDVMASDGHADTVPCRCEASVIVDPSSWSTYQVAEFVASYRGTIQEASKFLSKSAGSVSELRGAWDHSVGALKAAWKEDHVPFSVVKLIASKASREGKPRSARPPREQDHLLDWYLRATEDKTRKSRAKAHKKLLQKLHER